MNFKKEKIFFVVVLGFFCLFYSNNFVIAGNIRAMCGCAECRNSAEPITANTSASLTSACREVCDRPEPEGCAGGEPQIGGHSCVTYGESFDAMLGCVAEGSETEETKTQKTSEVKAIQLESPLVDDEGQPITDIVPLIGRVIKTALGVVGAIALLMFVYGGLIWLTSGGTPDKIKKGMDVLLWAAIGLVVIFASYTLVDFVFTALGVS